MPYDDDDDVDDAQNIGDEDDYLPMKLAEPRPASRETPEELRDRLDRSRRRIETDQDGRIRK